jgi:hypothetical protein
LLYGFGAFPNHNRTGDDYIADQVSTAGASNSQTTNTTANTVFSVLIDFGFALK